MDNNFQHVSQFLDSSQVFAEVEPFSKNLHEADKEKISSFSYLAVISSYASSYSKKEKLQDPWSYSPYTHTYRNGELCPKRRGFFEQLEHAREFSSSLDLYDRKNLSSASSFPWTPKK